VCIAKHRGAHHSRRSGRQAREAFEDPDGDAGLQNSVAQGFQAFVVDCDSVLICRDFEGCNRKRVEGRVLQIRLVLQFSLQKLDRHNRLTVTGSNGGRPRGGFGWVRGRTGFVGFDAAPPAAGLAGRFFVACVFKQADRGYCQRGLAGV
jgi:hypothetical protein